jgi:flavin reductase (DIM6/NTAB) family NADH-FMN oxidoreductase RutF
LDNQVFKEAMRRLAASVCVITAQDDNGPHGCTATAVCSLSAEPPSLLCCLNKTSRTSLAISSARTFAVNVMALPDMEIANIFPNKFLTCKSKDDDMILLHLPRIFLCPQ